MKKFEPGQRVMFDKSFSSVYTEGVVIDHAVDLYVIVQFTKGLPVRIGNIDNVHYGWLKLIEEPNEVLKDIL